MTYCHQYSLMGLFLAVGMMLASCAGDDDLKGFVPEGEAIRVVQNDLTFSSQAGEGLVIVDADGTITATTDADWCQAAVSGKTVTVQVEANDNFNGRTALLTIQAGTARRQVPVQQQGMVLDLPLTVSTHHAPREGEVFTTTLQHSLPVDLSSPQDWLHPVLDGNTLRLTVDSNDGGHLRRGVVTFACGDYRDTLRIAQYDLQDDIVGSYYIMGYYGGDPNTPSGVRFDILLRNDSLLMHWPQDQYASAYIPVTLDVGTATLFIPSGFVLRNSGNSTTTGYFYDTNGTVATASGAGATARLAYIPSSGFNGAALQAANWLGHTLKGFIVYVSSAFVSQTLLQLGDPVLMRVGPVGTSLSDTSRLANEVGIASGRCQKGSW